MARRRKMTPERKAFIDSLLEHYQPSDVQDVQEMLKDLLGDTLQGMLEAEMDQKLGYSKYDYQNKDTDDSRNGYSHKTVTSSMGDIELDIPRDRKGEFEPQIVKKHQTDISNIEDQVLSMYAKGMTTRDFSTHLHDVYGVDSQKDDPVIDYLEKESIPFVLVGKTDRSIHDTIYVDIWEASLSVSILRTESLDIFLRLPKQAFLTILPCASNFLPFQKKG